MHRWKPDDVNLAGDLIADRLRELGVPVTVHRPTIYLSVPHDASVTAAGTTYRAKPPSSSANCPEGMTGELVYVPSQKASLRSYTKNAVAFFGEEGATLGARLKGRILLTEGFGNPALTALAEEWGAVGVIAINPGVDIHWGTCTTIWGTPDLDDLPRKPKIPVVSVNKESGTALISEAEKGNAATIKTVMEEGWFEQAVPVVDIAGTDESGDFVLLHGHYDSWDVGVGDNATGDATMLEIARILQANRGDLRRSVRIAWWPGHSTGRYAGSTWFADYFAQDLDRNCVAQVNCDSPGCRWATSYHQTTCMAEMQPLVKSVIEEVAGQTPIFKRPNQAGDYSFNNIGLSSFYMLSSTMPDDVRAEKGYYAVSGCGGNIAWHTENDTLEIADKDVLMRDIQIYLLSVLRLTQAEVVPVEWRMLTAEFAETLKGYQAACGHLFDFSETAEGVTALDTALADLDAAFAAGKVSSEAVNTVRRDLARVLVPLNYTRATRFRHDPAITCPPLPMLDVASDLAAMDDDMQGFGLTQALRANNRVIADLRAARKIVEAALA
ncbi:M28 family peptidase [Alphaproteobacteria bacterium KMM 3653]|uniref:Carboxypeptidase Q n=1 Tax=Harenicola maris TaxID=2841044 RepID=A0AAP2G430_9RHOB|nr:M28 family peptidase [Harenicola maris]